MQVICTKCGNKAHSKCPMMRSIFPDEEGVEESYFWQGMSFDLIDAGEDHIEGIKKLRLLMLHFPGDTEEETMKLLIRKIKQIPDDKLDSYVCKHRYRHTENCQICSFVLVRNA